MARRLSEGRRAIAIYPKNVPQRNNVGLYAMYAGDFAAAITEQNEVIRMNPRFVLAYVGLALSQLAEGHADLATETWRKAEKVDARAGLPTRHSGSQTIALSQGRPGEAAPILEKGMDADLAAQDPGSAAVKLAALAEANLERKQTDAALASADRAVSLAKARERALSGRACLSPRGREAKALALAADLSKVLEQDPQAYAELIRGEAELSRGKPQDAIRTLENARKLADTWMGHFLLGRAYLEAGAFPDADRELEICVKRRGEATALFSGRGADVADIPAGPLLPRPREAGVEQPGGRRLLSGVPGDAAERLRRPPRRGRSKAPRGSQAVAGAAVRRPLRRIQLVPTTAR
jgi:tetratricopeptide (TPR) repeat protein